MKSRWGMSAETGDPRYLMLCLEGRQPETGKLSEKGEEGGVVGWECVCLSPSTSGS